MSETLVKICGVTDEAALDAAVENNADFLGFVFFDKSPRAIAPEKAAELCDALPDRIERVGLFVNPTNDDLDDVLRHVRLDMVQLHGSETPERVDEIRMEFGVRVMKAIGIMTNDDVAKAAAFEGHADWLLFDAKAPAESDRPGGLGEAFPWPLMQTFQSETPWLLAGGLNPDNVTRAISESGTGGVDVSSGVENAPGSKDPSRIAAFLKAAKGAGSGRW